LFRATRQERGYDGNSREKYGFYFGFHGLFPYPF
jgi:hypothetical protein